MGGLLVGEAVEPFVHPIKALRDHPVQGPLGSFKLCNCQVLAHGKLRPMETQSSLPNWQKGIFVLIVLYLFIHWLDTAHLSSLFR
jgi:hypothetical protein